MKQVLKISDKIHQLRGNEQVRSQERGRVRNDRPYEYTAEYKNQYGFVVTKRSMNPKQGS